MKAPRLWILLFACLLSIPPRVCAQAPETGTITGTVVDAAGHGVSGAQITVLDTKQTEVTDTSGAFTVAAVAVGTHTVEASLVGYEPVRAENVAVAAGQTATVHLQLAARKPADTGVTAVRVPLTRNGLASHQGSSQTVVSAQGIDRLPETTSLNNVIEAAVPGAIALPNGAIRIRGSDNQYSYYLDGAPLPANLSVSLSDQINPKSIETLRVYTGGIPAAYGGQLSAVMDITSKGGQRGEPEGMFQQLIAEDATYETTAQYGDGKGPFSYFLSGFRNSTFFGLNPPSEASLHNHAWSNNGFARLDYQLDASDRLTLHLDTGNSFYQLPNPPDREAIGQDDRQRENKDFLHLIWQHEKGPSTLRLVAYANNERLKFEPGANDLLPSPGDGDDLIPHDDDDDTLTSTFQDEKVHYAGLRGDYAIPFRTGHRLQFGFDVNRVTGRQNFQINFDPDSEIDPVTDNRRLSGGDRSVYVQDDWTPGRFRINYGVRYDVHKAENTTSQVSPRLNLSYQAGKNDVVHAFYDRLFMPVPVENVNFLVGPGSDDDNSRTPVLPERQHYFETGLEHKAGKTNLSIDAYYRTSRNIVDNEVLGNTLIEVPVNEAKGIIKGIELSIDRTLSPTTAIYASYARSVGLAKGPLVGGFLGAEDFPPGYFRDDHDLPNVATVELTHRARTFSATLTGEYSSGFPYGEIDDEDGNPTSVNYLRLPSHFTMNALVESRSTKGGKVGLLVTNIFNKRYIITQDSPFRNERWAQGRLIGVRLTQEF